MKTYRILGAAATAALATGAAAQMLNADVLLDLLRHDRHAVSWDAASPVAGDFDGDGQFDMAAVGVEGGNTLVIAVANQPVGSSMSVQYLGFPVDASAEAGLCSLHAQLRSVEPVCRMGQQPLPGCRGKPGAAALQLVDEGCRSFHLYWDHDSGRMNWARVRDAAL